MDGRSLDRSLLKNGPFGRLWAAQFSAVTVVYSLSLAGVVLVEQQTHSSIKTGLVILSSILPAFLTSLVAGAVVDRRGQVPVLMVSHAARALLALAFWLGLSLLTDGPALALIYAVNVAGATFNQFALTSELALLPDLVGKTNLVSANALVQFGTLAAEGMGIVLLGPLVIRLAGAPAVGLMGAVLCLTALALVTPLPRSRPAVESSRGERGTLAHLLAGLRGLGDDLLRPALRFGDLAVVLLLRPGRGRARGIRVGHAGRNACLAFCQHPQHRLVQQQIEQRGQEGEVDELGNQQSQVDAELFQRPLPLSRVVGWSSSRVVG